jgi:hypothetical protein
VDEIPRIITPQQVENWGRRGHRIQPGQSGKPGIAAGLVTDGRKMEREEFWPRIFRNLED